MAQKEPIQPSRIYTANPCINSITVEREYIYDSCCFILTVNAPLCMDVKFVFHSSSLRGNAHLLINGNKMFLSDSYDVVIPAGNSDSFVICPALCYHNFR